ncbi:voltage-gated potassium channel [Mycobacterium saskatchewanense]|uniref:Ion transporter n=1 Tax=Mycobacterium saskatchewanense TaxID=220927 RepID=A0AAJ3TXJ6_9MYCO|nr:potassium channel family protein [Mycobacterium saskatchewanense]ORW73482.1 ion transporter [Mycobacterium saskatchewanense]BBX62074.1 voltage-gated potassium channel [Mycobacterium saskatchewanense]
MIKQTWGQRWEQRTEWPLAIVALIFLAVYSVQVLGQPHGREAHDLDVASWVAWGMFVVDYLVRLSLAPDRRQWFVRHLFDLLVVALPLMRPLRLLRLVVLVGALQKAIGNVVRGRILLYTISGVILLIYVASLAILDQERGHPGAKIQSFGEAVWWAISTVTTVGYGDQYPITVPGRVIAVLLMVGGISLIGVVTASLASWIVQRVAETDTANQAATASHIEELRAEIQALSQELRHELRARSADQPSSPR